MPAHKETKHSPYNVEQLLALVADIESYPEFLPWCSAARIIEKNETEEGTVMLAELVVRFKNFRDSYVSEVRISKNDGDALVLVEQKSGPFSELNNSWHFTPDYQNGGTTVAFVIEFNFRSKLLGKMIELLFSKATQRMTTAFAERAHVLYGNK